MQITHPGCDASTQVHATRCQRSEAQVACLSANDGQEYIHCLHCQRVASIQSGLCDCWRILFFMNKAQIATNGRSICV